MTAHWDDGVIHARGEIDMANAQLLRAAIGDAEDSNAPIVIDCSDLDFVDSSGLGVILSALRRGVDVTIRTPSPSVRRVLEIAGCGLIDGFRIVD